MAKEWFKALRLFVILSILTGVLYPLLIFAFAQIFYNEKANGSLLYASDHAVGSKLIAQRFTGAGYFWPRSSVNQYDGLNSGGSNLSTTSVKLKETVQAAEKFYASTGPASEIPNDLLFASASGLDPDISPAAARFQIARVAKARGIEASRIETLVNEATLKPQLGFLGDSRVNVLLLNRKLDQP